MNRLKLFAALIMAPFLVGCASQYWGCLPIPSQDFQQLSAEKKDEALDMGATAPCYPWGAKTYRKAQQIQIETPYFTITAQGVETDRGPLPELLGLGVLQTLKQLKVKDD